MTIAVTGAYGQLGGELCRQLGTDAMPLDIDTLDLTDGQAVVDRMLALKPAAIINCAAYTQVDKAESEPEKCRAVNATAVEHLVRACGMLDCPLVQISTDYVFGAASPAPRPWREDDPPSPQGVYAPTKLEGEQAAAAASQALDRPHLRAVRPAVRLAGGELRPDHAPPGQHAARAARRGRSALHADLRAASGPGDLFLVGADGGRPAPWGTYHVTNTGQTTWYDFAAEIFRQAEMQVAVRPITTAEYGAPAAAAVVQRARHDGLPSTRRPADARLEGRTGGVFCGVEGMEMTECKCKMQMQHAIALHYPLSTIHHAPQKSH